MTIRTRHGQISISEDNILFEITTTDITTEFIDGHNYISKDSFVHKDKRPTLELRKPFINDLSIWIVYYFRR